MGASDHAQESLAPAAEVRDDVCIFIDRNVEVRDGKVRQRRKSRGSSPPHKRMKGEQW